MHISCHTTETIRQYNYSCNSSIRKSSSPELFLISSKSSSIPFGTAKTLLCSKLRAQPCTTLHNLAHIAATQQFDNTTTLTTYLSGKVQVLNFFSSPPNHLPSHFGIKTLHRIYSSLHDIFSNSRIHSYLVHPLSPFPPPPVVLSPLYLVRDCGMASAARCPLVALILGACGLWFAEFVIYS